MLYLQSVQRAIKEQKLRWLVLFLSGSISVSCLAAKPESAPNWQRYKQNQQVSLAYRSMKLPTGPTLELQIDLRYAGSLSALLNILQDTATTPDWLEHAESVRILQQTATGHWVVYSRFERVWPVQGRDMLTCSDWQQLQPDTLQMLVYDCSGVEAALVPKQNNLVRINNVRASWHWQQIAPGQIQLRYQGFADPGGDLPIWLKKRLALSASWNSFNQLANWLQKPQYQSPYPAVIEPTTTAQPAQ